MEMRQEAAPDADAAWWNEMPEDLQLKILAWLPLESVCRYAIVCKEWNDLLSSNYFINLRSSHGKQPQLVLCDRNINMPSMAFCFYTRTWIKSCFTLSFLQDLVWWMPQNCNHLSRTINCKGSVAGLLLLQRDSRPERRVCNPYTRTFVDIPRLYTNDRRYFGIDCIVVEENNNRRSDTAFKLVSVGWIEGLVVHIYDPFQKRWNIAGTIREHFIRISGDQIFFCNGSFYSFWHHGFPNPTPDGIMVFTIPLEGSGSAAAPIPVLLAPLPQKLRNVGRRRRASSVRLIMCGSRLLIIASIEAEHLGGEGDMEVAADLIIWEFKIEKDRTRLPSNPPKPPSWEWVEIVRMPLSVCIEWMNKFPRCDIRLIAKDCIGIGDQVCFLPCNWVLFREVLTYNLVDNTWYWLPGCPTTHGCVGCDGRMYSGIAFQDTRPSSSQTDKIQ